MSQEFGRPLGCLEEGIRVSSIQRPIVKDHGHGDFEEFSLKEGYHRLDGLNGAHTRMPNLVPQGYRAWFDPSATTTAEEIEQLNFIPSKLPAHIEILNLLRSSPSNTITVVAVGTMTNLALAAAEDPEAFARAKRILIMGGALRFPQGNETPRAEFNIYGDPDAAAEIFNLSSPSRAKTSLGQKEIQLVPLDITSIHTLSETTFRSFVDPLMVAGSPLAVFLDCILAASFLKIEKVVGARLVGCHDPLTVYTLLEPEKVEWEMDVDIRVERYGEWTRGETVIDTRGRLKWIPDEEGLLHDNGHWLHGDSGNSIAVLKSSGMPGKDFGEALISGIFKGVML